MGTLAQNFPLSRTVGEGKSEIRNTIKLTVVIAISALIKGVLFPRGVCVCVCVCVCVRVCVRVCVLVIEVHSVCVYVCVCALV